MPSAWVPNSVAEAILNEAEGRKEAQRMVQFRARLKALDSRFGCFCADKNYPDDEIRMGFWYVFRRNEDGTVAFWEISSPDGSYREPGEDVIAALQKGDANRTDLRREREAQRRADARRREKRDADRREAIHDRLKDEFDYAFRVQIPIKKGLAA